MCAFQRVCWAVQGLSLIHHHVLFTILSIQVTEQQTELFVLQVQHPVSSNWSSWCHFHPSCLLFYLFHPDLWSVILSRWALEALFTR